MPEHEENYNKPWEVWAYEKCRECGHWKYMHLLNVNGTKGILGECQELKDLGGFCECLEWMPPDNLDYVEVLAKKKGLILEEQNE